MIYIANIAWHINQQMLRLNLSCYEYKGLARKERSAQITSSHNIQYIKKKICTYGIQISKVGKQNAKFQLDCFDGCWEMGCWKKSNFFHNRWTRQYLSNGWYLFYWKFLQSLMPRLLKNSPILVANTWLEVAEAQLISRNNYPYLLSSLVKLSDS